MLNTQKLTNLIREKSDICEKESYHETGPADLLLICPYLSVLTFFYFGDIVAFSRPRPRQPKKQGIQCWFNAWQSSATLTRRVSCFRESLQSERGVLHHQTEDDVGLSVDSRLGHRLRRQPNLKSPLVQCVEFVEFSVGGGGGGAPSPRPLSDEISVTYLSNIHAKRSLPSWVFLGIQFPRRWSCPDKTVPPCFFLPRPPPSQIPVWDTAHHHSPEHLFIAAGQFLDLTGPH